MQEKKEKTEKIFQNAFFQKGVWTVLSFLILAAVWILAAAVVGNGYLLPSLSETLKETFALLGRISFWTAFFATLFRALTAFLISFVLAAGLSVVAYTVGGFEKIFSPILSFLRSLPTMAVLLMIFLWTSASKAPIFVACLVLFPMLYSAMTSSLAAVDKDLIEMSKAYEVPKKRMIFSLYIPSVLPTVCRESATSLSFSLKLIVSAEVMSNTFESLGGQMQSASLYAQTPTLFALVLTVFLAGYALECLGLLLTNYIERRLG